MRTREDATRGIALLEVMVAAALLGASGLALVAYAAQSAHALALYEARETEMRNASALLTRLSLMRVPELRRWRGDRVMDGFRVRSEPDGGGLIAVTVFSVEGGTILLRARLYPLDGRADDEP
jgi:type II secretory pathway component PulJ